MPLLARRPHGATFPTAGYVAYGRDALAGETRGRGFERVHLTCYAPPTDGGAAAPRWRALLEQYTYVDGGSPDALSVVLFDESFAAFTEYKPFFEALGARRVTNLQQATGLLDDLGAVDTDGLLTYKLPAGLLCPGCRRPVTGVPHALLNATGGPVLGAVICQPCAATTVSDGIPAAPLVDHGAGRAVVTGSAPALDMLDALDLLESVGAVPQRR